DANLHAPALGDGPSHVRPVPSASHVMAKRAHAYPQVDPGAAALVDAPVASVPRRARVRDALRLARRRQAAVVSADGRAFILRDDLARAARLGLGELPAATLARPPPVVESHVSRIAGPRPPARGRTGGGRWGWGGGWGRGDGRGGGADGHELVAEIP